MVETTGLFWAAAWGVYVPAPVEEVTGAGVLIGEAAALVPDVLCEDAALEPVDADRTAITGIETTALCEPLVPDDELEAGLLRMVPTSEALETEIDMN